MNALEANAIATKPTYPKSAFPDVVRSAAIRDHVVELVAKIEPNRPRVSVVADAPSSPGDAGGERTAQPLSMDPL